MGNIRSRESGLCLDSMVFWCAVYRFTYQTDISGLSITKYKQLAGMSSHVENDS